MILIGIIYYILVIGLKILNSILLNRFTIILLIYSTILTLPTLKEYYFFTSINDIHFFKAEIFSGLWHITTLIEFIELLVYIFGSFILLLGEQSKFINNRKLLEEYGLLILLTIFGMICLINSNDLFSFFLAIELQSFPLYILASIYRNNQSATESALKYYFLGALSSSILLLGISLIYGYTGITNFTDLALLYSTEFNQNLQYNSNYEMILNSKINPEVDILKFSLFYNIESLSNITVPMGIFFLAIALLFKIAAVPFHFWAPDVYDGVPTIITSWIAILPKISIIILILILYKDIFNNIVGWNHLFLVSSALSLITGSILGLAQYKIKRLLAYSSISHIGFILLGISILNNDYITNMGSTLFYTIQYIVTSINIFLILNSFSSSNNYDIETISQLKGFFIFNPLLTISFAISLFSMAGKHMDCPSPTGLRI